MKTNIRVTDLMKITGKSIGTRIRQVRNIDSQEELAKKTGISISAIRNYERDLRTPSIETIEKIAKTYGISPVLITYGNIQNLVDNEKLDMINRIMMLDEEEKKAMKTCLKGMEMLCIIKKQQEKK